MSRTPREGQGTQPHGPGGPGPAGADRRTFLARLGAAAIACAVVGPAQAAWACAPRANPRRLERIGIQLYTMREAMGRDFDGTLERLGAMGYDEVEFAGYFDRSPAQVRAALERAGLSAPAAHVGFDAVRDELAPTLETAAAVGHRWVVCAWIPQQERTTEGYRRVAELFNRAGEAARGAGLRFAYHNHDFVFEPLDGTIAFDLLLAETDPALVDFEMDLYWISKPGYDPLAYFERHPGRFPLVHVKDMDGSPERRQVDPGQGVIDFPSIVAAREQAGIRHWFVEHDQPADPFEDERYVHHEQRRQGPWQMRREVDAEALRGDVHDRRRGDPRERDQQRHDDEQRQEQAVAPERPQVGASQRSRGDAHALPRATCRTCWRCASTPAAAAQATFALSPTASQRSHGPPNAASTASHEPPVGRPASTAGGSQPSTSSSGSPRTTSGTTAGSR
jgi:sugar phosphate isomerase/epimerase